MTAAQPDPERGGSTALTRHLLRAALRATTFPTATCQAALPHLSSLRETLGRSQGRERCVLAYARAGKAACVPRFSGLYQTTPPPCPQAASKQAKASVAVLTGKLRAVGSERPWQSVSARWAARVAKLISLLGRKLRSAYWGAGLDLCLTCWFLVNSRKILPPPSSSSPYKYIYGGSWGNESVRSKVCDWPVFPQNGHFTPAKVVTSWPLPFLVFLWLKAVAMRLARLKSRGATLRV